MAETVEQQYRRFLLMVSGFIFLGSIVELVFVEHYESVIQLVPFGLAAIGLVIVLIALYRSSGRIFQWLRYIMIFIALGSLFGVYEHLEHNYEFALEIKPNITAGKAIVEALYGASPIIAPGILCLGAVLAYAATWRHPKIGS